MSDLVAAAEKPKTVLDVLDEQRGGFEAALAGRIGVERFTRAAVTAFRTTPALANCDMRSVLGALFVAAQLGLEVGGPQAHVHLVPYGNQCQLLVGYRGYMELFYRGGARKAEWFIIREGDTLEVWSDSERGRQYKHVPADFDSDRPMIGAIAQVKNAAGDIQFEYMTVKQINERRPKNWERTPWKDWPEQMAVKTVMRQLAKTVRTSSDDLAIAVSHDDAVVEHVGGSLPAKVQHVEVEKSEPEPHDFGREVGQ